MGLRWPKGAVCSMGPRASARSTNSVKILGTQRLRRRRFCAPRGSAPVPLLGTLFGKGDALAECKQPQLMLLSPPQHVADDLQWQRADELGDQVTPTVGVVGAHRRNKASCAVSHRVLDAGHHLRGERPVYRRAQPRMARIAQRDHRPEILGDLRGHIIDRDAGGTGAEDLWMTAGMMHVVKFGQRPMSPTNLISGRDRFRLNEIGASRRSVATAPSRAA